MRRLMTGGAAALFVMALALSVQAQDACHTQKYDTTVNWHTDYDKAVDRAGEEGRLLFLMHISGDLPDAAKT